MIFFLLFPILLFSLEINVDYGKDNKSYEILTLYNDFPFECKAQENNITCIFDKVPTTPVFKEEFGFNIEYIDIGGGFASKNRLKGIYQSPEVVVPSADEYAEAVTNAIYEVNKGKLPKLYLETGRALIDEAGFLLTSVFAHKRLPDGKKSYIVDAGVNLLYTAFWYNFEIFLDKRYEGLNEPSQINGPLCMNIDVINENIMLPPLNRGSVLTIWPVGAYNVTQWMQFIRYRPAVVLIDKGGNPHLIREKEDLNDIIKREKLPEYLK